MPEARPTAQLEGDAPQLPGGPPTDPDRTRQRADEILDRPEYRGPDDDAGGVLRDLAEWISDRLPDVDAPSLGGGTGDAAALLMAAVLGVGGLAALAWFLAGTRGSRRREPDIDASVDVTPIRSAEGWAEEAERCERDGDHRGAVRARFRSLTAVLAERGLVADTPGRTAGELRGDVAERAPGLEPAFGAVADLFERAWYGSTEVGPEGSRAARELAERARAAAPRQAVGGSPARAGGA